MKFFTGLLVLASTLLVSDTLGLKKAPEKLTIGIKKRIPESECERKAKNGDFVSVHYTGTLFEDGTEFDSSIKRGPFEFKLGSGNVIKGWDLGLLNMCIGEKRKLVIPYDLAYGEAGSPPTIPAKATLVFETELIGIRGYEPKKKADDETKEEEKEKVKQDEKADKDLKEDKKVEKKSEKKTEKKDKKADKKEEKKEKKEKKGEKADKKEKKNKKAAKEEKKGKKDSKKGKKDSDEEDKDEL